VGYTTAGSKNNLEKRGRSDPWVICAAVPGYRRAWSIMAAVRNAPENGEAKTLRSIIRCRKPASSANDLSLGRREGEGGTAEGGVNLIA